MHQPTSPNDKHLANISLHQPASISQHNTACQHQPARQQFIIFYINSLLDFVINSLLYITYIILRANSYLYASRYNTANSPAQLFSSARYNKRSRQHASQHVNIKQHPTISLHTSTPNQFIFVLLLFSYILLKPFYCNT